MLSTSNTAPASSPRRTFGWPWRRLQRQNTRKGWARRAAESACIIVCATVAYLLLGELAVRVAVHASLLKLYDFRHERAAKTINRAIEFDSLLGWHLRPFIRTKGFNTLDYGFRSNGSEDNKLLPGGVVAVGSSFTAGSEVDDDQSWPAHLEQITGWNAYNAGVGAYVADQIIMNGERLLPLMRPQVLVVDLIPDNIIGANFSSYGWPKPYFTVENDSLVAHNSPVPRAPEPGTDRGHFGLKLFLGHFAIADQFMTAFFADEWFSSDGTSFVTLNNDPIDVTCRLLARLKKQTDADHVALILYLQFSGSHIISTHQEPEQSVGVGKCASAMQITTIDEYALLRREFDKDPQLLRGYYQVERDGSTGHKSSFGNMEVAKLVAAAIREQGVAPTSRDDPRPLTSTQANIPH
jgi:hypothetical protein